MNWKLVAISLAAAVGTGCFARPASLILGQTAELPRPGKGELAVSAGPGYIELENAGKDLNAAIALPETEGNLLLGLSDRVALNVHLSNAGLQPGAKIALIERDSFQLALLPEVGLGDLIQVDFTTSGRNTNAFNFLAGAKVIGSAHHFFFSVGYDFQALLPAPAYGGEPAGNATVENFTANVGYEIRTKPLVLRPEVAFQFSRKAGSPLEGYIILPCLTVALGSEP